MGESIGRPELARIIDGGQSKNIWRLAFRNVLFSPPFGSAYMPSQIAALAFKGGECYACKKQTLAVPESFSLNVRFCSLFCKQYSTLARDVAHYQTLPFVMPYLEGTRGPAMRKLRGARSPRTHERLLVFFFLPSPQFVFSFPCAKHSPRTTQEHHIQDPELDAWMLTAEDLCNSADRYKAKKEGIDRVNYTILEDIAAGIHLSVTQLVSRSPTLARHGVRTQPAYLAAFPSPSDVILNSFIAETGFGYAYFLRFQFADEALS
ncbi:hypothetical protein R3P38DRAFT_2764148 [Favolaschia claudopus]|uniref:Uncharacterized protein n=1 Tax=Favolaschia claudopus TaxID=2862362 RepID=A0AAW0D8T7_9AGAR